VELGVERSSGASPRPRYINFREAIDIPIKLPSLILLTLGKAKANLALPQLIARLVTHL